MFNDKKLRFALLLLTIGMVFCFVVSGCNDKNDTYAPGSSTFTYSLAYNGNGSSVEVNDKATFVNAIAFDASGKKVAVNIDFPQVADQYDEEDQCFYADTTVVNSAKTVLYFFNWYNEDYEAYDCLTAYSVDVSNLDDGDIVKTGTEIKEVYLRVYDESGSEIEGDYVNPGDTVYLRAYIDGYEVTDYVSFSADSSSVSVDGNAITFSPTAESGTYTIYMSYEKVLIVYKELMVP